MSMLNTFRSRGSKERRAAAEHQAAGSPIEAYDDMDDKAVIADLSRRSQEELAAIEAQERANGARAAVLNKLRYLRGKEPLPGYDTLDADAAKAALADADLDTLEKVRTYERKFRGRREVLDEVDTVLRQRLAAKETAAG
jgi:hypothetical protein